jgi:hypothetical protein
VFTSRGTLGMDVVSDCTERSATKPEFDDSDAEWASCVVSVGLSWPLRAWKSCDCLPLTGVTGSLGGSLSVSSPSSRIDPLMSVGYCRGDDGNDDKVEIVQSDDELSVPQATVVLADGLEIRYLKLQQKRIEEKYLKEADVRPSSLTTMHPTQALCGWAEMRDSSGDSGWSWRGSPWLLPRYVRVFANAGAEWLLPTGRTPTTNPGTLECHRLSIGGPDDLEVAYR